MEMVMELLCTKRQREREISLRTERERRVWVFNFSDFNSLNSEGQYCPLSAPFSSGPEMGHKNSFHII